MHTLLVLVLAIIASIECKDSIAKTVHEFVSRRQSVAIRGRLFCGDVPMKDTRVKLWDEDTGPDPDDLMAEGFTNSTGHFALSGTQTEMTNIDPKLKIYHMCDVKDSCKRKLTFTIPSKYIYKGDEVEKWFEFGDLNMELIHRKEGSHCLR